MQNRVENSRFFDKNTVFLVFFEKVLFLVQKRHVSYLVILIGNLVDVNYGNIMVYQVRRASVQKGVKIGVFLSFLGIHLGHI